MEGKVTQNSAYQNLKTDFEESLKANKSKKPNKTAQELYW